MRLANAERQAAGFRGGGAARVVVATQPDARPFGTRLLECARGLGQGGLVVLGSGAIPLAGDTDRRELVDVAMDQEAIALTNNRFSGDVVAIAEVQRLVALDGAASSELRAMVADNRLPRWLAETAGYRVFDRGGRTRLQVDLDSPLDAALLARADRAWAALNRGGGSTDRIERVLDRLAAIAADPTAELVVHGRTSARTLGWLERSTASRTRALVEERGLRTSRSGQRPARSIMGELLDRDGPEALGSILAAYGDGAIVDSRVLLAHRLGADEAHWPSAEDRFASDLLDADAIEDPWLRRLTAAARDAVIPIVLGGHSVVGPGLRLALRPRRRATGSQPWT
jgi:hypothetical protein